MSSLDTAASPRRPCPSRCPHWLLCQSQEECDAVAGAANACSKRRVDMLEAYEIGNTAVSVFGNTVATLCGCMFVSAADICVLQMIPYTCTLPYAGYIATFTTNKMLWEAVKL